MPCSLAAWRKAPFPHENAAMDRGGIEEERRLGLCGHHACPQALVLPSHSQTRMLHGQTRYNTKSRLTNCQRKL